VSKKSRRQRPAPTQPTPAGAEKARFVRVALVLVSLAVVCGTLFYVFRKPPGEKVPPPLARSEPVRPRVPDFNDFLGSEACASCHRQQYDLWNRGTHGKAGGQPSPTTVIARFDG